MRKLFFLGLAAAAVVGLVAASPSTPRTTMSAAKRVVVSTRKLPKLGTVLVNGKGFTLYMFVRDKRKKVTCVHACAKIWPPLKLRKGAKLVAERKAKRRLLGSDRDPAGGRVVTYHKWPLYTYVADTRPGQAKGQALRLNGGLWYVLAPSGAVIRKKP